MVTIWKQFLLVILVSFLLQPKFAMPDTDVVVVDESSFDALALEKALATNPDALALEKILTASPKPMRQKPKQLKKPRAWEKNVTLKVLLLGKTLKKACLWCKP